MAPGKRSVTGDATPQSKFADYAPDRGQAPRLTARDGLAVREALDSDLPDLAAISAERGGGPAARWLASFRRIHRDATEGRALVLAAALDSLLIGFGKAQYFTPPQGSPPNAAPEGWYLSGLVVRPEHRRHGVGALLTSARLAWIAERSGRAYYVANARNRVTIDLHRTLGFVELTRDFHHPRVEFEGGDGVLFAWSRP